MSAVPVVKWGMKALVGALSELLVNELRLAGHADLVDGGIAFGAKAALSRKSPPRVVFVPSGSSFTGVVYGAEPAGVRPVQPILQSLGTDMFMFDVHVWGCAEPPDPDGGDLDDTRYLIHQIVRCTQQRIFSNSIKPMRVTYDPDPASTLGQHATLQLQFSTPIVDTLEMYLQPGTIARITIENEASEVAEVINLPPTGS